MPRRVEPSDHYGGPDVQLGMFPVDAQPATAPTQSYVCVICESRVQGPIQRTVDPRWGLGYCASCAKPVICRRISTSSSTPTQQEKP